GAPERRKQWSWAPVSSQPGAWEREIPPVPTMPTRREGAGSAWGMFDLSVVGVGVMKAPSILTAGVRATGLRVSCVRGPEHGACTRRGGHRGRRHQRHPVRRVRCEGSGATAVGDLRMESLRLPPYSQSGNVVTLGSLQTCLSDRQSGGEL